MKIMVSSLKPMMLGTAPKQWSYLLKSTSSIVSCCGKIKYRYFTKSCITAAQSVQLDLSKSDDYHQEKTSRRHELVSGKLRKVTLLLGYCGENYHGVMMDRGNRRYPTIERELLLALLHAKQIPPTCWHNPIKMHFVIASRTDKGVSACGQIISLFLILNDETLDLINANLPPDIRVLAIQRATKRFSAWQGACSRVYTYTLPTFVFAHHEDVRTDYRLTPDKFRHLQSLGYRLKGVRSFHNFTDVYPMNTPQAVRIIREIEIGKPFIEQSHEFITIKVKVKMSTCLQGQSFIRHQIRMMIGLMIAVASGRAGEDYYIRAFSEAKLEVPLAPGSGLVLEEISYSSYNKTFGHLHGDLTFSNIKEKIQEFRKTKILPAIIRNEVENNNMMEWLESLDRYEFRR